MLHIAKAQQVNEYNLAFKRTLLVELLEEDPETIKKMEKKADKKPEALGNYQQFISSYNASIEDIMKKYWKLNDTIEFRTTEEIRKLWKTKSNKYMLIYLHQYNPNVGHSPPVEAELPVLEYQRSDRSGASLCGVFAPVVFNSWDDPDVYTKLLFTVQFLQNNILHSKEMNKKVNTTQFVKVQEEMNCNSLSDKRLLIDKSLFNEKVESEQIKNAYPHSSDIITDKEIDEHFKNGKEIANVLVAIPVDVIVGKQGILSISRTVFIRAIVNPYEGKVM